jgi:hypothetical protein
MSCPNNMAASTGCHKWFILRPAGCTLIIRLQSSCHKKKKKKCFRHKAVSKILSVAGDNILETEGVYSIMSFLLQYLVWKRHEPWLLHPGPHGDSFGPPYQQSALYVMLQDHGLSVIKNHGCK